MRDAAFCLVSECQESHCQENVTQQGWYLHHKAPQPVVNHSARLLSTMALQKMSMQANTQTSTQKGKNTLPTSTGFSTKLGRLVSTLQSNWIHGCREETTVTMRDTANVWHVKNYGPVSPSTYTSMMRKRLMAFTDTDAPQPRGRSLSLEFCGSEVYVRGLLLRNSKTTLSKVWKLWITSTSHCWWKHTSFKLFGAYMVKKACIKWMLACFDDLWQLQPKYPCGKKFKVLLFEGCCFIFGCGSDSDHKVCHSVSI